MPLIYATPSDLATWTGSPAPDNAAVMLREASGLVGDAIICDLYEATSTGLPTNPTYVDALRDATCAQVEHWIAAQIDPLAGAGGQEPRMTVSAIDGASVSFDTYLTAPDRLNSAKYLAASSWRILRRAGLGSSWVSSW